MTITSQEPVTVLLQVAAAHLPEQDVTLQQWSVEGDPDCSLVPGGDGIGERVWATCDGRLDLLYRASVVSRRIIPALADVAALPLTALPGEALGSLFESRYCRPTRFETFVTTRFAGTSGGARVQAIHDWVAANIAYEPGTSDADTDAVDTFLGRQGVCRDFAHLVVTMARASDIPARFVSCYAPDVTPQDFHAVAEVFLADPVTPDGGYWHMVDATGMAAPADIAKIGVGRDAADVSFMTAFGNAELEQMQVNLTRAG